MTSIRIKSNKKVSWSRLLLIAALAYSLGFCMNYFMFNNPLNVAALTAIMFFILPIAGGLISKRKQTKLQSYFISWNTDQVSFNTGSGEKCIPLNFIETVKIKFDEVLITDQKGKKHSLILDEFHDAEDRKTIKDFFQQLVPTPA